MKTEEKKRNGISMMVGCFAMAGSSQTNRRGAKDVGWGITAAKQ